MQLQYVVIAGDERERERASPEHVFFGCFFGWFMPKTAHHIFLERGCNTRGTQFDVADVNVNDQETNENVAD